MTYAELKDALGEVIRDLATRTNTHSTFAQDWISAKRGWEVAFAKAYIQSEGKNKEEREARALLSLMTSPDYKAYVIAEANFEGSKAAMRALETRASALQSLLKAESTEGSYSQHTASDGLAWSSR